MAEDPGLTIADVASQGVVKDTPPVSLAHNIFTDVRNVRFKDGAIRKIEISLGNGIKKITEGEVEVAKKLRAHL